MSFRGDEAADVVGVGGVARAQIVIPRRATTALKSSPKEPSSMCLRKCKHA
ncbi:MAG: hypothetical protein R2880_11245 [Deinococcales bacterium]